MSIFQKIKFLYLKWKYRNAPPEVVLGKLKESVNKVVDSLEKAWESKPEDLPMEEQMRLSEILEKSRQMQNSVKKILDKEQKEKDHSQQ